MITFLRVEGNFQNSLPWLIWCASLLPNDIGGKTHKSLKIITFEHWIGLFMEEKYSFSVI